jgi:hypothetical protein
MKPRGEGMPEAVIGAEWIPLAGNHWTLVDPDDATRFSHINWHLTTSGYAAQSLSRALPYRQRFLHREILGLGGITENPVEVDHINGNRLDNRKSNLRLASHAENSRNVKPRDGKMKRVDRHGAGWRAQIKVKGKTLYLGVFPTPEEAARAYNQAAIEHFGQFAALNAGVE